MTTLIPPAPTADAHAAGAMLGHLFDEHGRMVLGVCRIYLHDVYEAEDAAQETLVSAHRSLLSGRQPEQAGAWLAAIARNECRDRIRRDVRRNTTTAPAETFERMPAAGRENLTDQISQGASLQQALADLPESQREAFVLREMLGLRYDEIAKALDTTESAVESLLVRARRSLQNHLRPLRLAPVALVVPFALRESIAHAVVGFPVGTAASTGVTTTVVGAGAPATSGGASTTSAAGGSGAGATPTAGVTASGGTTGVGVGGGATAAASASTAAVATSAPVFGGIAAALATPLLAKLAVAGAATAVAATMAVSKPWDVETRLTGATPAGDISPAASGNDSAPGGSDGPARAGNAGASGGASEPTAEGTRDANTKPEKGKNKRNAGGQGNAEDDPGAAAEPGPATLASAPTIDSPADETAAAAPSDDGSPESGATESSSPTAQGADNAAGKAKTNNRDGAKKAKTNNRDGAKKDKTGKSSNGKGTPALGEPGKGKKRGHEEDGPGNSNEANGKTKTGDAEPDAPPTVATTDAADGADTGAKGKKK